MIIFNGLFDPKVRMALKRKMDHNAFRLVINRLELVAKITSLDKFNQK
jgi:hypothetical protein